MVEGFVKKFFSWVEKKTNTWFWNKILKPFLQLFTPHKDDM